MLGGPSFSAMLFPFDSRRTEASQPLKKKSKYDHFYTSVQLQFTFFIQPVYFPVIVHASYEENFFNEQ